MTMTPNPDSVAVLREIRAQRRQMAENYAAQNRDADVAKARQQEAALDAAIAALEAQASAPEHPEAAEVCAMAYQVVGSLLSDVGAFDTELGEKILDCLSEHRMVHPVDEILPWPSFQQASAPGGEVTNLIALLYEARPIVRKALSGSSLRIDATFLQRIDAALAARTGKGNPMVADIHTCSYQCDNPPCIKRQRDELLARIDALTADAERLDYIERTFSGMTNRERYLPVQMIWGKGCNGRTLRKACDNKYMKRDTALKEPASGR